MTERWIQSSIIRTYAQNHRSLDKKEIQSNVISTHKI